MPHVLHLAVGHEAEQRPRDAEPQRPRLAGPPAAAHGALEVEASQHAHELQREHQLLSERKKRERERENGNVAERGRAGCVPFSR